MHGDKTKDKNIEELGRLSRRIKLDRSHALHFVVVKPLRQVSEASDRLESLLPSSMRVVEVHLGVKEDSPINEIINTVPNNLLATTERPIEAVIFVYGLSDVLRKGNVVRRSALNHLNAERDKLRQLRVPTIFWIREDTLHLISSSLPDLWSWTTSVTVLDYSSQRILPVVRDTTRLTSAFVQSRDDIKEYLVNSKRPIASNEEEAEDILQAMYVNIAQSKYDSDLSPDQYMHFFRRLAEHMSVFLRERSEVTSRRRRIVSLDEAASVPVDDHALDSIIINEEINEYLRELPEPLRQVFVLVNAFGYSADEIALLLSTDVNIVRRRLSYARQLMNRIVRRRYVGRDAL
jgi:RNA polymerase sigma factor (sigma-70 family)